MIAEAAKQREASSGSDPESGLLPLPWLAHVYVTYFGLRLDPIRYFSKNGLPEETPPVTISRPLLAILVCAACAAPVAATAQTQQPTSSLARGALGLPFIEKDALQAAIYELASPRFEGRLTGTPGHDLAVRYGVERFRAAGVQPGGTDATFLQPFVVEANNVTGPMELDRKSVV